MCVSPCECVSGNSQKSLYSGCTRINDSGVKAFAHRPVVSCLSRELSVRHMPALTTADTKSSPLNIPEGQNPDTSQTLPINISIHMKNSVLTVFRTLALCSLLGSPTTVYPFLCWPFYESSPTVCLYLKNCATTQTRPFFAQLGYMLLTTSLPPSRTLFQLFC